MPSLTNKISTGGKISKMTSLTDAYTYDPYTDEKTRWRSSEIPHAPITFRPDNPDKHDYGSQNIVMWDLEKVAYYYPHRRYDDYGRP